jgi:iron complex transport system permease protein
VKRFDAKTMTGLYAIAIISVVAAGLMALCVGSTGSGWPSRPQAAIRFETHVLPAALIGCALAAAGLVFQAVLRNPLADPYLLGTSGGAMLASYLWRLPYIAAVPWLATLSPFTFALGGAGIATAIVLTLAAPRGRVDPLRAILVGVIINSLCGALFLLLNSVVKDYQGGGGALTFLVGDIQTTIQSSHLYLSATMIGFGMVVLIGVMPSLNIVRLSDDEAAALGARLFAVRWVALGTAAAVTAAAVAISGPIGFVGLICPHVARWLVGNDNRRLLPITAALGATVLIAADTGARFLSSIEGFGALVPIGVITALVGGPFVLVIVSRLRA